MAHLNEYVATCRSTTGTVLAALAGTADDDDQRLIAALLTHPRLPDEVVAGTWRLTDRFALEQACDRPHVTARSVRRTAARADDSTLLLSGRFGRDLHPHLVAEIVARNVNRRYRWQFVTDKHLAKELVRNQSRILTRDLLVALRGVHNQSGLAAWAATRSPALARTFAREVGRDDAQLVQVATADDPRAALRADLLEHGRGPASQPGWWAKVVADTGDVELAHAAWAAGRTPEVAYDIVSHPRLAGTDLAWQAHLEFADAQSERGRVPRIRPTTVPRDRLRQYVAGDLREHEVTLVLERADLDSESVGVLAEKVAAAAGTGDPMTWAAHVTAVVTHPACPDPVRTSLLAQLGTATWDDRDPSADGRVVLAHLSALAAAHGDAAAGLALPVSVVRSTGTGGLWGHVVDRWMAATVAATPALRTDPHLVRVAVALFDSFSGTVAELLEVAEQLGARP